MYMYVLIVTYLCNLFMFYRNAIRMGETVQFRWSDILYKVSVVLLRHILLQHFSVSVLLIE